VNRELFASIYQEEVYDFTSPLTVVMDVPWGEQPTECKEALSKILGGVGLSPASVQMVHQPTLDLSAWVEPPSRLVAFVSPPKGIALYEKILTPKTAMVIAEPLAVLLTNDAAKRSFWTAFKTLFA